MSECEPRQALVDLCLRAEAALQASDWSALGRMDGELRTVVANAVRAGDGADRAWVRRLVAVFREAAVRARQDRGAGTAPLPGGASRAHAAYALRRPAA